MEIIDDLKINLLYVAFTIFLIGCSGLIIQLFLFENKYMDITLFLMFIGAIISVISPEPI